MKRVLGYLAMAASVGVLASCAPSKSVEITSGLKHGEIKDDMTILHGTASGYKYISFASNKIIWDTVKVKDDGTWKIEADDDESVKNGYVVATNNKPEEYAEFRKENFDKVITLPFSAKANKNSSDYEDDYDKIEDDSDSSSSSNSSSDSSSSSNPSSKSSASSATSSVYNSISPVKQLGNKLHAQEESFDGATIYNGVLTFVLNKDVAYNGVAGLKGQQKGFLYEIITCVDQFKNNSLAKNGILVTGGYIKDDDGYHVPTIALYFNREILDSSSLYNQNKVADDPTSILFTATASYVYGQWLLATTGKGIYEGVHLVNVQTAPDWFTDVYTGEIDQLKPTTK